MYIPRPDVLGVTAFVRVNAMIDVQCSSQHDGRGGSTNDWTYNTGIVEARERNGSWTKAIDTMSVIFAVVALCSACAAYIMQLYGFTGPTWTWDRGTDAIRHAPVSPGVSEAPSTELV